MDAAGFNLVLRAMTGGDTPTDPVVFADLVLHVLEVDLGTLREALSSPDPDTKNASQAVSHLEHRLVLARDVLEQLRQREAA